MDGPKPPARGEGQWKLGFFEPLNRAERTKRDNDGLDVVGRIHQYAQTGFRSIDKSDLRSRFRWYGLYTQRNPNAPVLGAEPDDLDDEYFMMRVRVPNGILNAEQVEAVGRVSETFGRNFCDVTDRQNFQLHWIRIEDVPEIWRQLEEAGLTTLQTCGDVNRNVLGCPLAGVDESEYFDASPLAVDVGKALTGTKEFSNLPRKYKISITACRHQCAVHEVMDIGMVGHGLDDGRKGFDLWVGGGLGPNPFLGHRLGVFVEPQRVVEVCTGITGLFRDYGYRRARNHARMKFLVADWGPAKFRQVLESEYLSHALEDGLEAPASHTPHKDHVGVHRQRDGRFYVGFAPVAGRISGQQLTGVASIARRRAQGRLRNTTQQKMVMLDVEEGNVDSAVRELETLGLAVGASPWRTGVMACTGIEFCKLAVTETKARAAQVIETLERRIPEIEGEGIQININGCPNSCARFQIADIGLMGALVADKAADGTSRRVDGFLVHLGGHLGAGRTLGRKVKGKKVKADDLAGYIERVVRRFLSDRTAAERFSEWIWRLPESELSRLDAPPSASRDQEVIDARS